MDLPKDLPAAADREIAERVFASPLANTHEHLWPESMRLADKADWTIFFDGYASGVFQRCGMSQEELQRVGAKDLSPEEKWQTVAPYWPAARLTGVIGPQLWAMRDLYGVEELTARSARTLTEKITAANRPGYTRQILQDRAGFHHCQICSNVESPYPEDIDQRDGYLLYDLTVSGIISGADLGLLETKTGREIGSLDQYLDAVDWCFDRYGRQAVALKDANCYRRPLNYRKRSRQDAARAFDAFRARGEELEPDVRRVFEDYVYYHVLGKAEQYDLPVRIHFGYTAGITPLTDIRPQHFEPIIKDHPNIRFVLLHAGYPFMPEALALCMAHANARFDLGWIWQLDPVASQRMVLRFVTSVGPRQLILFGGDTGWAEASYGYSLAARRGLVLALTRGVGDGWVRRADVDFLIDRLMVQNARECFRLGEKYGL